MNPAVYMPRLEPVPHPECDDCKAASKARAEAHMAGRTADVRRATETIQQHRKRHRA